MTADPTSVTSETSETGGGEAVQVLLAPAGSGDWRDGLDRVVSQSPLTPFDERALEFTHMLSKRLTLDRAHRDHPQLVALGHWLRQGHVAELKSQFEQGGGVHLARGVALHFAPTNVDTLFVYSWMVALLVGNANIVRVSKRRAPQADRLIAVLAELFAEPETAPISDRTLILTYEHDEEVTAALSRVADVRMIWGGDETISNIRAIPLPPRGIDLPFADRFSMAAMEADAVLAEDEAGLRDLARKFCGDALTFDQMACSSPRLVVWTGTNSSIEAAQARFWPAFEEAAASTPTGWGPEVGMLRLVTGCQYVAEERADRLSSARPGDLLRVRIKRLDEATRQLHCGGGLFLELELPSLADLAEHLSARDQTLAVFGHDPGELRKFAASLTSGGVDRIVPIGAALDFDVVWDGHNLLRALTREVTVTPT